MRKISHFDLCMNENCERKWCVDRRNAACLKAVKTRGEADCEVERGSKTNRCKWCHTKYFCSNYGVCELHGDHGP